MRHSLCATHPCGPFFPSQSFNPKPSFLFFSPYPCHECDSPLHTRHVTYPFLFLSFRATPSFLPSSPSLPPSRHGIRHLYLIHKTFPSLSLHFVITSRKSCSPLLCSILTGFFSFFPTHQRGPFLSNSTISPCPPTYINNSSFPTFTCSHFYLPPSHHLCSHTKDPALSSSALSSPLNDLFLRPFL